MKAKFEVRDICVKYGERRILDHVGLEIFEGEFCGLLGLNGSGKTTLLHAICGFIPTQGGCFVNGIDCGKLNERKRAREIALIPQTCSFFLAPKRRRTFKHCSAVYHVVARKQ